MWYKMVSAHDKDWAISHARIGGENLSAEWEGVEPEDNDGLINNKAGNTLFC